MAPLSLVSAVPSVLLALLVLRASTWACLLCFTSYAERFRLCKMWARGPRVEQCQEAFTAAFKGLSNVEISKDSTLPGPGPAGGGREKGRERERQTQAEGEVPALGRHRTGEGSGLLREGRPQTWRGRQEDGHRGSDGEGQRRQRLGLVLVELPPSPAGPPPSDYWERSHLQDAFTQMAHSLQEAAAAQGSFEDAFPAAAEEMRKAILQLKEGKIDSSLLPAPVHTAGAGGGPQAWLRPLREGARPGAVLQRSFRWSPSGDFSGSNASPLSAVQPCVPPCGVQEVARRFFCNKCFSSLCKLPLDCPVQDVTVNRGEQAMFSCVVGFQLPPEEVTYTWKFAAGGMRTRDVSYFREVPQARGYLARIRPVQPKHRGTFSCVIKHDQRPLARLYFFLNVTGPPPRGETDLQAAFREVVSWAPRDAEMIEPWRPSLGELLARPEALTLGNLCMLAAVAALASAMATMLVWMFFRWYLSGN
ncbi:LOW QUALITY PROTEIN: sperm acrosome membrane-associated protein 6 [Callospermophilus lateralis]